MMYKPVIPRMEMVNGRMMYFCPECDFHDRAREGFDDHYHANHEVPSPSEFAEFDKETCKLIQWNDQINLDLFKCASFTEVSTRTLWSDTD